MGLSKSTRIIILLAIDSAFFFLELVTGYAVHSLALVADSFHMLNDVLSLCVGLWAVKVATQKSSSKMYTYGWQRAETLGALINGVFLVALCLSIFLEAIQRFVEPQEVTHPKMVLVVGCAGLASNIIGLFLFHEHGHSHGGHGHSHGHSHDGNTHADELSHAEEGHAHIHFEDQLAADEGGNVADVLPQNRIGGWPTTKQQTRENDVSGSPEHTRHPSQNEEITKSPSAQRRRNSGASRTRTRGRAYSAFEDIYVHPSRNRDAIIAASRYHPSDSGTEDEGEEVVADEEAAPNERTSLLPHKSKDSGHKHKTPAANGNGNLHKDHIHEQPKSAKKGGHSHGDLNIRGVFLHVMGDALGNVGVIASAAFIWLTDYSWRFYTDPGLSLVITVIILCSAIPLCKAASRILLQAVPAGISIDDIKDDINDLPGVVSCHHLHVWQLSDTKLVASLHVQVSFDFKHEGSERYMSLAKAMRKCLHEYGIHSSTIQPEFCLDPSHPFPGSDVDSCSDNDQTANTNGTTASNPGSVRRDTEACLLACGDECGAGDQCCQPVKHTAEDPH